MSADPATSSTLQSASAKGINLASNAFLLVHGWAVGPILLDFVSYVLRPLAKGPKTLAELVSETQLQEGPLAILLRTCRILQYVAWDQSTKRYRVRASLELDELAIWLRPGTRMVDALRGLYSEVIPPFKMDSEDMQYCLAIWKDHRPSWRGSQSQSLVVLLDGIVLAPLLASIIYNQRWRQEDGTDLTNGAPIESLDFSALKPESRQSLGQIFEEMDLGSLSARGLLMLSKQGMMAAQRCYSYLVPASYAPMLSEFDSILSKDASWGFKLEGNPSGREAHVDRQLNVVGSGVQHKAFFKDLLLHVASVFSGEDFASQPAFVVDTGCGDGSLLVEIYNYVKNQTPRGNNLMDFPLMMVGVDLNDQSRVRTALTLSKQGVPHMVFAGDISNPAEILAALAKKKVDGNKSLHVRSFVDHDRKFVLPEIQFTEDSIVAAYVREAMADAVYLDRDGRRLSNLDVFCAAVEHFERWADALRGSFGLCLVEAMLVDVESTSNYINDSVSFHFDMLQSLSRQYLLPPHSFSLAAARAGLVPSNVKSVQTYPEHGAYCRAMTQRLEVKPYRIRFAELTDMPVLMKLEATAWSEEMRATAEVVRKRLLVVPTGNFVCELDGKVVSVLYTQRVSSVDIVDEQTFMSLSDFHRPDGRVLQLIAISVDPEVRKLGIGNELRGFALHLARVEPSIDCVIGVTRCRSFQDFNGTMEDYVKGHVNGTTFDPVVGFHTGFGAKVQRLVHNFRPEDTENNGIGVLIKYDVNNLPSLSSSSSSETKSKPEPDKGSAKDSNRIPSSTDIICDLMASLQYPPDKSNLRRGFYDYGMDSLELVRMRNKLSSTLGMELPATLLLECPSIQELSRQLDKDRGLVSEDVDEKVLDASVSSPTGGRIRWDSLAAKDILQMQEQAKESLTSPQYQRKFTELARKCYPDMCKYILAVEESMMEVEGTIFQEWGLIEDRQLRTVQRARGEWTNCLMRHWAEVPEVRSRFHEILHITKQDQIWS